MEARKPSEKRMDFFGIGAAVRGAVQTYLSAARGTGRTTFLLENVREGDRVVFATVEEQRQFQRLLRDRDLKVDTIIVPVSDPGAIFRRGTPEGRTILDHVWVERFYLNALEDAQRHLAHIERESSGYGQPHRETLRAAQELSRWRP